MGITNSLLWRTRLSYHSHGRFREIQTNLRGQYLGGLLTCLAQPLPWMVYPEQFLQVLARRAALFAHGRSRPRWPYLGHRPHFLCFRPFLPRLAQPPLGSPASKRDKGSQ